MACRRSPRRVLLLSLFLLLGPGAPPLPAQPGTPVAQPGDSPGRPATPRWSFWLQNTWATAELLALLFAAYQLWARRAERRRAEAEAAALALKAANYQAWVVVNSAQGKGGSGGRIDALQDLNRNAISLAGVRLDGAWLEQIDLPGARLNDASLRGAMLSGANLAQANLTNADLTGANLTGANLRRAVLRRANLSGARLGLADLRGADLTEVRGWEAIETASYLLCAGVQHPPAGFVAWALQHGALAQDTEPALTADEESYSHLFRSV